MDLKKTGKVFTSKFAETGPSSYKKRIYRAAVPQRLRNTDVEWSRYIAGRSPWPFGLRLGSTAALLLGSRVRIPLRALIFHLCLLWVVKVVASYWGVWSRPYVGFTCVGQTPRYLLQHTNIIPDALPQCLQRRLVTLTAVCRYFIAVFWTWM